MTNILPINTLAGRGIGDNSAAVPLAEVLRDELATDKARADELLAAAREARIETEADAGKVADLVLLLRDHERAVDRARETRKRPYLADCRIIDAAFGAVTGPLARARTGPGSLSEMLTAWRREHADAAPVATIASIGSRKEISFVIDDLPATIEWLLRNRGNELAQAARTILSAALRSAGVNGAPHLDIPGVRVEIATRAQVR
jgi:hypothetical protein